MAIVSTIQSGNASNTTTWSTSALPNDGDTIIVSPGNILTWDLNWANNPIGNTFAVSGTFLVPNTLASGSYGITLNGNMTLGASGKLWVGSSPSSGLPWGTFFTINLNRISSTNRQIIGNSTVSGSGAIQIYGTDPVILYASVPSSSLVVHQTILPLDTDVTSDPQWGAGNFIWITSPYNGSATYTDFYKITSVSATSITVSGGLSRIINYTLMGSIIPAIVTPFRNVRITNGYNSFTSSYGSSWLCEFSNNSFYNGNAIYGSSQTIYGGLIIETCWIGGMTNSTISNAVIMSLDSGSYTGAGNYYHNCFFHGIYGDILNNQSSNNVLDNCICHGCSSVIYNTSTQTLNSNCTFFGNQSIWHSCFSVGMVGGVFNNNLSIVLGCNYVSLSGCVINNSMYAIETSSSCKLYDCVFTHSAPAWPIYSSNDILISDCSFTGGSGVMYYDYGVTLRNVSCSGQSVAVFHRDASYFSKIVGYNVSVSGSAMVDNTSATFKPPSDATQSIVLWNSNNTISKYPLSWLSGGRTQSQSSIVPSGQIEACQFICENSPWLVWTDISVWAPSGVAVTANFWIQKDTLGMTSTPQVQFVDPNIGKFDASSILSSYTMVDNTNTWQTSSITYTSSYDRTITFRVVASGGTIASPQNVYWSHQLSYPSSGGGGGGTTTFVVEEGY